MFSTLPLSGPNRGSELFSIADLNPSQSILSKKGRGYSFTRQSREDSVKSSPGPGTYDVFNVDVMSAKKLTPRAMMNKAKRDTSENFMIAKDSPGSGAYSGWHDKMTIS